MGVVLLCIVGLGIPLWGLYQCIKEHKQALYFFGVGIMLYVFVQICLRIPILHYLNANELFFAWTKSNSFVYVVLLSVCVAVCEELSRWLSFRIVKNSSIYSAIALGLGYALIESLHGIIPYISSGYDLNTQVYIFVCIQQGCSLVIQVALSLLVYKAYKEHAMVYLLTAGFLHTIYILVPFMLAFLMPIHSWIGKMFLVAMTGAIAWYSYTTVCKNDDE